jgi:hypothetical protein
MRAMTAMQESTAMQASTARPCILRWQGKTTVIMD